jgi:hypothetical protein
MGVEYAVQEALDEADLPSKEEYEAGTCTFTRATLDHVKREYERLVLEQHVHPTEPTPAVEDLIQKRLDVGNGLRMLDCLGHSDLADALREAVSKTVSL